MVEIGVFGGEKEEFFGLINLFCFLCLYLKQLNAKLFIKKKISEIGEGRGAR